MHCPSEKEAVWGGLLIGCGCVKGRCLRGVAPGRFQVTCRRMSAAPETGSDVSENGAPSAETVEAPALLGMLKAGTTSADVGRHLDSLTPEERLRQVLSVKGKWVKALYETAAGSAPVSLEEFVPESTKGTTVIYEGRNSLAMFTRFQKRFLRTQSGVIVGYNHQSMQWVTGPGYFVFQAADGEPPVPNEAYIDYITEPPEIPEGWPPYKPNTKGLSKSVYANMHDYMRRVANGVYVGKAYRGSEDIGAYFSLTLQPPAAEGVSS